MSVIDLDKIQGRRNRIIQIRAEMREARERGSALKEQLQALQRQDGALGEELRKLQEQQYEDVCGWDENDRKMQLGSEPWPRRWES